MKVIILAAGKGSRLAKDIPKALIQLDNGQSILEMQLEALSSICPLEAITVVVGYQKAEIVKRFPKLHYIDNDEYLTTNTSQSLLKAIQHLQDDLLWINGDVVFHPSVLQTLLKHKRNSMLVNEGKVGKEEVKYLTNPQGHILEISKHVKNGRGEALGVNFFKASSVVILKKQLQRCAEMDYFEKGIEGCLSEGMIVHACPVDTTLCIEVDFAKDLVLANQLVNSWK